VSNFKSVQFFLYTLYTVDWHSLDTEFVFGESYIIYLYLPDILNWSYLRINQAGIWTRIFDLSQLPAHVQLNHEPFLKSPPPPDILQDVSKKLNRFEIALSFAKQLLGYVHTGVVFERFQKRFCPFNCFDALFTWSKGKYLQCIE
jgi:hypothetical protein